MQCGEGSGCGFVFFNDTATTEIYTLSLHDALPICEGTVEYNYRREAAWTVRGIGDALTQGGEGPVAEIAAMTDRKSTRLNSSHANISYAVFCLKKKNPPSHMVGSCSDYGPPSYATG